MQIIAVPISDKPQVQITCARKVLEKRTFCATVSRAEVTALASFAAQMVSWGFKDKAVNYVQFGLGCSLSEADTFVEDAYENYA